MKIKIIALIVIVGLIMVSCDKPGTLTITGLDAYNGKYIFAYDQNLIAGDNIMWDFSGWGYGPVTTGCIIENGKITMPIWEVAFPEAGSPVFDTEDYVLEKVRYSGNKSVNFIVMIWDEAPVYHWHYHVADGTVSVSFNKGTATGVFAEREREEEPGILTITGLGAYIGNYIYADNGVILAAVDAFGAMHMDFMKGAIIYDDSIVLPVWKVDYDYEQEDLVINKKGYSGSDYMDFTVTIWEGDSDSYSPLSMSSIYSRVASGIVSVTFDSGFAAGEFVKIDY